MSVKIKDIPGVMLKDRYIHESSAVYMPFEDIGFNKALSQQGEVKIGINREKLAEELFNEFNDRNNKQTWEIVCEGAAHFGVHLFWLERADAIISKLPELLESVYTCSVCNSNPCQSTCSKQQFPMEKSET